MSKIDKFDLSQDEDLADEALDRVGAAKGSGSFVMTGFPKQ